MKPMLFCNIGWIANYDNDGNITDGGKYVTLHKTGGEIFNFSKAYNEIGTYYGYVEAGGNIHIERLGANKNALSISGVLVIWTAKNPNFGGSYIVGWYDNATVYRCLQILDKSIQKTLLHLKGEHYGYNIKADKNDVRLLNIDERVFPIHRKGSFRMGESNIWYAAKTSTEVEEFRRKVYSYVTNNGLIKTTKKFFKFSPSIDPDKKKQVETISVKTVVAYYQELGYDVLSVEKDNLGWDLNIILKDINIVID